MIDDILPQKMTSTRPYLLRAFYEWIVDNHLTPYIMADATAPHVKVPQQYVGSDGHIVLNLAPLAVKNLLIDNDAISFGASFGGAPCSVYVPVSAVLAIYARENGHGINFGAEEDSDIATGGTTDDGSEADLEMPESFAGENDYEVIDNDLSEARTTPSFSLASESTTGTKKKLPSHLRVIK